MAATNVNVFGKVKFFSQEKGFGIIITNLGDVFIHATKTGDKQAELVEGAEVRIDFVSAYKDGQVKHSATALLSVKAPPAPIEVVDVVKFYNKEKNFGFIFCGGYGFSKGEAILRGHVVSKAKPWKIIPDKGMPVRAMVLQKPEGPEVISYEWGPEVDKAYAAKLAELHAEDGVELDTADSVDELMAAHAAETQAALGQKPAGEDEQSEPASAEAAPAKPKQRRAPKAAEGGKPKAVAPKKPKVATALVHAEPAPNCALAGLAALVGAGKSNGAAIAG